jgi:hypothetical protein
MPELEKIYRRNENFVFRRIEGEAILVPIRGNVGDLDCIYSLNPVGALVWERLDGSMDLKGIQASIAAEYDVGRQKAEADLIEFIRDMEAIGAVTEARDEKQQRVTRNE